MRAHFYSLTSPSVASPWLLFLRWYPVFREPQTKNLYTELIKCIATRPNCPRKPMTVIRSNPRIIISACVYLASFRTPDSNSEWLWKEPSPVIHSVDSTHGTKLAAKWKQTENAEWKWMENPFPNVCTHNFERIYSTRTGAISLTAKKEQNH